ncbi:MAG: hypothetical protein HN764_08195 [Gammaproteobacteria bacterium]|jgi:hypothetical protein|nr:hypothetical protein [Gammaproteobacteria bacterium]
MSQDKQEQEFEAYLQGDSKLSTSYQKASSEQAPAHLDDAILAASRRAVKSKPRYAFSPFASDWHVPLSLAAVLVLSVTVIISIQYDSDESYLGSPETYEPQTMSKNSEGSFDGLIVDTDLRARKDIADEKEVMRQTEFDSAFAKEPVPAAASRIMKRENLSARKARNELREEVIVSPEKSKQKTTSDMPTPVESKEQSYARPPVNTQLLGEQEMIIKPDDIERQVKFKSKQTRTEQTKKRSALPISEKNDGAKVYAPSISSVADSMNKDFAVLSTDIDKVERSPKDWLDLIGQLWLNDKRDEALRQFYLFSKKYPDYDQKELLQNLDPALLEKAKTK